MVKLARVKYKFAAAVWPFMSHVCVLVFFLWFCFGHAQPLKSLNSQVEQVLEESINNYTHKPQITVTFEKVTKNSLLGHEKKTKGRLFISKGRLRMDTEPPENSLVVMDGEYIWVINRVSHLQDDFKGIKPSVSRARLSSKLLQNHGLIQLLTKGGLLKHFQVSGVIEEKDNLKKIFLDPRQSASDYKRVNLTLDGNKKTIVELQYWDHLDNETRYSFLITRFQQKADKELFTYAPPEGVKVQDL